jgi:hypothetical protein
MKILLDAIMSCPGRGNRAEEVFIQHSATITCSRENTQKLMTGPYSRIMVMQVATDAGIVKKESKDQR